MNDSLIEHFDKVVNYPVNVVFVDEVWAKNQQDNYQEQFSGQAKSTNFYAFDANGLTKTHLVKQLVVRQLAQQHFGRIENSNDSNYRIIIDALDAESSGVVVIYQSQLLSKELLHLISRVLRHIQRHKVDWKFIFFGQPEVMNELAMDQLFVEQFYPPRARDKSIDGAAVQTSVKKSSARLILPMCFILLAVAGFILLFLDSGSKQSESYHNDDGPLDVRSAHTQTEIQNPQTEPNAAYLEMLRQSKLRDLEFNGFMSDIDSKQNTVKVSDQPVADVVSRTVTRASSQALPLDIEQAVRANDLAFLKTNVDDFGLLNGTNAAGETPLIIATNSAYQQLVDWLLDNNVSVNHQDGFGQSALYYAAINGNDKLVNLLIRSGAKADLSSKRLKTPLMAAVHNDHYQSAQILLDNGADVNAVDHSGWSALFYAVWNANAPLVQLLKDNGASSELVDNSSLTVAEVATVAGHTELLDIL